MRALVIAALVAVGLSIAWHQRSGLQRLLAPSPAAPPKTIEFDNGTVRQYAPPASATSATAKPSFQPGMLRKCLKGAEVQYTNIQCPPGFKEAAVAGPPVTMLGSDAPRAATAAPAPSPSPGALRAALGVSNDERLRERRMERVIDGQP